MKRICFIEMEGILTSFGDYSPDAKKVADFLTKLTSFSKKNKIELYLLSAYHESVAKPIYSEAKLSKFFDKEHCLFVHDDYIQSKAEVDKKIHLDNLAKDKNYGDTYAKQVLISELLNKKDMSMGDALLLADDVWVDGYYSIRFSKIDFAIFENNILDRGKPIQRFSGLAYFNFDFDSVKQLIENFPVVNTAALEKYVFEVMKAALVGDKVMDSIKTGLIKKSLNG